MDCDNFYRFISCLLKCLLFIPVAQLPRRAPTLLFRSLGGATQL